MKHTLYPSQCLNLHVRIIHRYILELAYRGGIGSYCMPIYETMLSLTFQNSGLNLCEADVTDTTCLHLRVKSLSIRSCPIQYTIQYSTGTLYVQYTFTNVDNLM